MNRNSCKGRSTFHSLPSTLEKNGAFSKLFWKPQWYYAFHFQRGFEIWIFFIPVTSSVKCLIILASRNTTGISATLWLMIPLYYIWIYDECDRNVQSSFFPSRRGNSCHKELLFLRRNEKIFCLLSLELNP